jgi:hypothetical protein
MKISVNQFLAHCEKTNDPIAEHITSNFIASMRMCNPDRKDMTGADWLSLMLNDYHILVTDNDIQLVPNSGADFEIFTNYD